MSDTIPSILESSAEKYRDHVLFNYFRDEWKTMTYGEFFSLANNIASFLISYGVSKGDRIAMISENRPEWCASYIAIVMCGGIAVPIDMQLGCDEMRNLMNDSETGIVFCSSKTEPAVLKAIEGSVIKAVNFDAPYALQPETLRVSDRALRDISPDDVASIIYTSGTTGKPKGVMLTHRNLCADAGAVIRARVVTHNDNVLSVLPLHHTYPFMCTFLVPLFLGATVTFGPGLKASELVSAVKDTGVTVLLGVPRLFEMMRNGIVAKMKERKMVSGIILWLFRLCGTMRRSFDINIGKVIFKSVHRNFPEVRFFASGGARLDPSVMEDLEALGFTVLEGYGLTETAPVITFNPIEKRKPGSAGKSLPGVEIAVSDSGEIMAKGSMVMKGYYENPDATDEVIKDGWLLTGDIGYMDDEGYLFITGRKKEVIVLSSGKNIYPEDIEKAYMVTPLIKEMCVAAHERNGMVDYIQAIIVPDLEFAKKESIGNITEALNWKINEVSSRLPEHMRIKGYTIYSESLPRTPLGKLRRFMVAELLKSQEAAKAEKKEDISLMGDEMSRVVARCIRAVMDEETVVQATDNLELDLGFDSLRKIELISSLESSLSLSLPEAFIAEVRTVGEMVSALKEYQGRKVADIGSVSWKDILEKEPLPSDKKRVGYSHSLIELVMIYALFMGVKLLCRLLFRFKVEGGGHIPEEGPFVIAPNHASYLDGFVIAASVPFRAFRNLYFLGLQQFFAGGVRSWFARMSNVIPIDAETYLSKALQMSAYTLKEKRSLCIFPEGGRSFDGGVMPFRKGIGVLALELNIPVIPAYIDGAFKALPRGAWLIRPARIRVIFGRPLTSSDIGAEKRAEGRDKYQVFADELRQKVVMLADEYE